MGIGENCASGTFYPNTKYLIPNTDRINKLTN